MDGKSPFGAFPWMSASQQPQRSRPRSPTRHPRRSLDGMFSNLSISTNKPRGLPKIVAGVISDTGCWPNWTSLSKASGAFGASNQPLQVKFTIRTSQNYRQYAVEDDPEALFAEVTRILLEIQQNVNENGISIIENDLTEAMIGVIFSSNNIERAGLDLDETIRICRKIFKGEEVNAEDIDERSPEYQASIELLVKRNGEIMANKMHVIRSRAEIIQHAHAMDHMTRAIVIENQPLSEKLILDTHRILTLGIDNYHKDGTFTPYKKYGGIYRSITVGAGNTNFAVPKAIPKLMARMIQEFNKDIAEAEDKSELDPFYMAAKYSNEFVQIHPFEDGNGRVSRLILNAILLKYAGIVASIGEHDDARAEYIGIVSRAGEEMWGGTELAGLVLKKAAIGLKSLREKLSKQ